MASKYEMDLCIDDSLLDELECPVCGEYCLPPVFLCTNGHNVCGVCQTSLTKCPVCGVDGQPSGRCLIADKISEGLTLFCRNEEGRTNVTNVNTLKMSGPRTDCDNPNTYRCTVYYIPSRSGRERCVYEGYRPELINHVRKEHPRHFSEEESVTAKLKINFDKRIDYTMLISAHGELFWVEFWYDSDDSSTYLWASYVGRAENAARYDCEFKYGSAEGHIEITLLHRVLAEGESVFESPSVLPLEELSMEKLVADGYFSFTARILKK